MFMSLIVISDNDKPFKISQFSVWPICIINSVKVQQNLFSSGLPNFHFYSQSSLTRKISWMFLEWCIVTLARDTFCRLLYYCFSLVCTSWSHLCWFLSRDLLVLPESLWPSQDLVNTSGAIVLHWAAYWIRRGPQYNYGPVFPSDNKSWSLFIMTCVKYFIKSHDLSINRGNWTQLLNSRCSKT